jgi:spore coat protein U-like protein
MSKFIKLIFVVLGVFAFFDIACADDITTTFQVTASIAQECELTSSPSGMAFGSYIGTFDKTAVTSFEIACTTGTSYAMELYYGLNPDGTQRKMKLDTGSDLLLYNIFQEASHTNIWGMLVDGLAVTATGTGSAQVYNAYGLIPAGQYAPSAGNYSDTITLFVDY